MESNFDNIKKAMSENTDNQLPRKLDWDNMEAGILKKMGELQKPQAQVRSRKNRNTFLFGLFLLGLLITAYFLYFENNVDLQKEIGSVEQSNEKMDKQNNQKPNNKFGFSTSKSNNDFQITPLNHNPEQLNNSRFKNTSNPKTTPLYQGEYSDNRIISNTAVSNQINQSNDLLQEGFLKKATDNLVSMEKEEKIINPSSSKSTDEKIIKNISSTQLNSANSLLSVTTLPSISFLVVSQSDQSNLPISSTFYFDYNNKTNSNRLVALSGFSFWNSGYGKTKPERDQYEKNKVSYHAGLNYIHSLKNNYTFMIGIQYQQLESRFDYNAIIEEYQITLQDTIIEIINNINTGTQTEIRGDVDLTVSAERTIRHFNKTKLFQIPFAIGKTWTSRKWQADLLVGGSLNILSKNAGRTFYQGELQNFNGSSTDFLNNQMKFNGLLAGRLTYLLNHSFGITTGLQFQKSLSSWSTESNINMRPNVLNFDIGITYTIGRNR